MYNFREVLRESSKRVRREMQQGELNNIFKESLKDIRNMDFFREILRGEIGVRKGWGIVFKMLRGNNQILDDKNCFLKRIVIEYVFY